MYLPKAYAVEDQAVLVEFMRAHSFITLVSVIEGAPYASHLPVLVNEEAGALTLTGHLARGNPQWQSFGQNEAVAIFTGPHAYISPTLYERRESVPTWNYEAVHAYGVPQVLALESTHATLAGLIARYEPSYQAQWDSLPEKFRTSMLHGIVGFRLPVSRIEGKFKLSQNRSRTDQQQIAANLLRQPDPTVRAVGEEMQRSHPL